MSITKKDLLQLKNFIFKKKSSLYDLQYDSFHQFMEELIYNELKTKNIFYETNSNDNKFIYKYGFKFKDIEWIPATLNDNQYMFPEDARKHNLTYSVKLKVDTQQFQALVGSLIYASIATRPDISHAVAILSRHMSKPSKDHWGGAKRVLRYLKGTINLGLTFKRSSDLHTLGPEVEIAKSKMSQRRFLNAINVISFKFLNQQKKN